MLCCTPFGGFVQGVSVAMQRHSVRCERIWGAQRKCQSCVPSLPVQTLYATLVASSLATCTRRKPADCLAVFAINMRTNKKHVQPQRACPISQSGLCARPGIDHFGVPFLLFFIAAARLSGYLEKEDPPSGRVVLPKGLAGANCHQWLTPACKRQTYFTTCLLPFDGLVFIMPEGIKALVQIAQ